MAVPAEKRCTKCGETKPASEFRSRRTRAGNPTLYSMCKPCNRAYQAGWKRNRIATDPEYAAKVAADRPKHGWSTWTDEQKARYKRTARAKTYGLTVEEYDALLDGHERCPGCGTPEPKGYDWCIDHDHETGKVRGVLCVNCNFVLGHAKDNIATLTRLQAYLEVANAEH